MEEHTLETHGIYYRSNSFEPGRTTLVFIHGLSGSSSAWALYEEHFKNSYNVLTYDIRGHGKSKKYQYYKEYEIPYFVDDLHSLITHLGIEQFILISHSFGTMVAFAYLAQYQKNVAAAVFLSPILTAWNSGVAGVISPLLTLTRIFEFLPFQGNAGKHIDYQTYPNSGDWNIPRMIADVGNTGMRVYLYCTRQSLAVDYTDSCAQLTLPVLVLHGTKDSISPLKNSQMLSGLAKHTSLRLIDGADHIVVLNHAPRVCKEIELFISREIF